ncbi:dihydrofolate reductase [Mucilaginibacter aquatilis]|uniref:Dihydrofolate reductase n=1 Tax=Mucilaginibacter aquatilis TaxID=1517760 RepID=A0A6I4I8D6_9SPHI|nr:dihydrofolate reductase [Mucilaginibacter aquatilis]MVN91322.1 dihydrofolate reductase [Mucilaginibacter aquatilis]
MNINIVVAIATNNAIGKDNELLWHLPNDLKHFRQLTTGHSIIMGRKTYESVGKPLPNRRNIVVTRQQINIEGCEVVHSIDEALNLCKGEPEIDIIGGAEIYALALPLVNRIYLTIVHQDFNADAYFTQLNKNEWRETARENFEADEKHAYPYSFITLERR